MLRGLKHYWPIHLAVVAAAAVATAVLTGALIVGDSVRGSLRGLTEERLGGIESSLTGPRFFGQTLAERLGDDVAAAILLNGTTVHPDSGRRATRVGVFGVDEGFAEIYGTEPFDFSRVPGQVFPSVVINQALADELQAGVGDTLLLAFARFSHIPRDMLMGERDPDEVLARFRVAVKEIVPDRGVGRFGLFPHQFRPLNAFVDLRQLQRSLDLRGEANTLIARGAPEVLNGPLAEAVDLYDLGFEVVSRDGFDELTTRRFVIDDATEARLVEGGGAAAATVQPVQSYLANAMRVGGRELPYSLIAAVDPAPAAGPAMTLTDGSGAVVTTPGENEILLNTWAARDLDASVGATLTMDYYVVGPQEELLERTTDFSVAGIVAIENLGADRDLTPDYPGLQEADDISDWDPPFPVDLSKIRPEDEAYWDEYEATPKAFVARETGRKLWSSRYGSTTSIRFAGHGSRGLPEALRNALDPAEAGFAFDPVKERGLAASAGATDFSQLFIGFSFFLIVAAAMLVALLFGLGVEQRAKEVGTRRALGFRLRDIRRMLLAEGGLLAVVGAALGVALGVGYAAALMVGLRTLWRSAVGSSELTLHVQPVSLVAGFLIAVIVIVLSIISTIRRIAKIPPTVLLAGSTRRPGRSGGGRVARWIAAAAFVAAVALVGTMVATGQTENPALAFSAGAALLVAGLAAMSARFSATRRKGSVRALPGMAARNGAWNPGRSLLSVALVAFACFTIVAVASNRVELGEELERRDSAAGGFRLVAETDVPIFQRLDRKDDRYELGFGDAGAELFDEATIVPMRLLPGEDASCLNLYRPEKPRILGVPAELIERGGFSFADHAPLPDDETNPWTLLEQELEPGVVPAFGDAHSLKYILHTALGEELVVEDDQGRPLRLRLVGSLDNGLFQSELLIAESAFLRAFPSYGGYGFFLIDAAEEPAVELTARLEQTLGAFGIDVTTTRDRLETFKAVEHTYLSTFQLLGGFGLLLGTLGLGIVLLRNVIERRGELATLRAFGFSRARIGWLVVAENAFLLAMGILLGSGSALLAVAPRIASLHVPWGSVVATLAVVFAVGMLSCAAAVRGALRVPLLPALKTER